MTYVSNDLQIRNELLEIGIVSLFLILINKTTPNVVDSLTYQPYYPWVNFTLSLNQNKVRGEENHLFPTSRMTRNSPNGRAWHRIITVTRHVCFTLLQFNFHITLVLGPRTPGWLNTATVTGSGNKFGFLTLLVVLDK